MKSPVSSAKSRAALIQELEHAVRRSSAQGIIFGQTVAHHAGVSASDLECMDFLVMEERPTAGRLAELTGLTTGAITGVVDRLEKAGYVRRERDDSDRRKVFIAIVPAAIAKIGAFYAPLQRAMQKVWGTYSDQELRVLLRSANDGYNTVLAVTNELKAMDAIKSKKPRKP